MARDFLTTADECMRTAGPDAPGVNPADTRRVVPAITNVAFAAELSMKSGYVLSGLAPRRGHGLRDLFAHLPQGLRERIKATLRTRLAVADQVFDESLQRITHAFVQWRYVFEADEIEPLDYKFLSEFSLACYNTVRELGNEAQTPAQGPHIGLL
jgi:hypothetical protein